MAYTHNRFTWFECMTPDLDGARTFYSALFGWTIEDTPMQGGGTYLMISKGPDNGIGGMMAPPMEHIPPHWGSYLSVPDVDAAIAKVVAGGGKELNPAFDIPGVGRIGVVADAQGASLNLFKGESGDPENLDGVGGWMWNELWSSNAEEAVKFYTDTFGFGTSSMDMGPMGTYHILNTGDEGVAGVMNSPSAEVPPMWLPYVHVENADASAEKATSLGAEIISPPQDIPGVGRFYIFKDPTGAVLAAIQPAS